MTPPTKVLDAARLLGAKVDEIASVEKAGDELVIVTTDGVTTTVAADGSLSYALPGVPAVEDVDDQAVEGDEAESEAETPAPAKKATAKKAAAKPAVEDDDDDDDDV